MGSPFAQLMVGLLRFFAQTYKDVFSFDNPPLHDPLAIAYVIDPSIFTTKYLRVEIETQSDLSAGQTVVDIWGHIAKSKPLNVHVAFDIVVSGFWDLMFSAWASANSSSSLNI